MENAQNKSLKNFFLSNKKILYLSIGLLFLIIIFFWWSDSSNKKERFKNSEDFISAKVLISKNDKRNSLEILKSLILKNDDVYSPLSLFLIIDNNLENNKEKILDYFDKILAIKSLKKEDLNLIRLKKAIYISENANEEDILNLLNPILNSDSVWRYKCLKLLGDYYFNNKKYNKAKQYYSDLLLLDDGSIDASDIKKKMKKIKND
tara:strand:- start:100 stop:717 length:618 start_codon:yes stop_codon:yes gene_type:complete